MTTTLLNNRYRLLQTLAQGGFGETYLAEDTHLPSAKKCVIKKLQPATPTLTNQQWVKERFQREAAVLETLGENNAQIPKLFAYFSEGGNYYLVQEWIQGKTLKQKVEQEGPLSETQVRNILASLLPVLDYVHSHQIVHRDIKPENIILRDSDNKPVLIDFGAVKEAVAKTQSNNGKSPKSTIAIGTPGYMPSEQSAGRPVYSSDLYSLALTGIYLLSGQTPEDLEVDNNTAEIIWRKALPGFNSSLSPIIDRALRFSPRDRFLSAKEMLHALGNSGAKSGVATVAIAPGRNNRPRPVSGRQTAATVAVSTPTVEPAQKIANKSFNWLIALLLIFGVGIGSLLFMFHFVSSLLQRTFGGVSQTPPPAIEQPTTTPEVTETPTPEVTETPTPEVTETPTPEVTETPTPEVTETPTPEVTETPDPPKQPPKVTEVPVFTTRSTQQQISSTLGDPPIRKNGYWPKTTEWSYPDYVPNQVNLSYIFDNDTDTVLQTEVSFGNGVEPAVIKKTLRGLLGGNLPDNVKGVLNQVIENKTDRRTFRADYLKGVVHRDSKDRIHIEVWEANFH